MTRTFLNTEKPLLNAVVQHLFDLLGAKDILDWSRFCLVVPTRHSGRRLREALAVEASRSHRAIIPPQIHTPESFLSSLVTSSHPIASEGELLWAMTRALLSVRKDILEPLLPNLPDSTNFASMMAIARSLCSLRASLSENGLTIQKVLSLPGLELQENERWQCLAFIEQMCLEILNQAQRSDPCQALQELPMDAQSGNLHFDCLILAALPMMTPVLRKQMASLDSFIPCETWIHAHPDDASDFDELGTPIPDRWLYRPLPVQSEPFQVIRCLDTDSMIAQLESWLKQVGGARESIAIGLIDPSLASMMESRLTSSGIPLFNPAGKHFRYTEIFHTLHCWRAYLDQPGLTSIIDLARIGMLSSVAAPHLPQSVLLAAMDNLRIEYLVESLQDIDLWVSRLVMKPSLLKSLGLDNHSLSPMQIRNDLLAFFEWAHGWRKRFESDDWRVVIQEFLEEICSSRALNTGSSIDKNFILSAGTLLSQLDQLNGVSELSGASFLTLLLDTLSHSAIYPERSGGEIDSPGWLELLWEPAGFLALVGFQDHCVPESRTADIFLPEKLRLRLGLPGSQDLLARDTFIMHALVSSRLHVGQVTALTADFNSCGNPLRPSRLCFLCDDSDLPAKVSLWMGEKHAPKPDPVPPFQNSWKLKIPSPVSGSGLPPERMSVTAFSRYLECPFRYFLSQVVGMETVDSFKIEMDPSEFGSLFHAILEDYGRNSSINQIQDGDRILQYFIDSLNRHIHQSFGSKLPAALWIQHESLVQRLAHVAQIEARERAQGWQILHTEVKIHESLRTSTASHWKIGATQISGIIDRIEFNPKIKKFRIIDFKTSSSAKRPMAAHLIPFRNEDPWHVSLPDWQILNKPIGTGRSKSDRSVWINIQLPLYVHAFQMMFPSEPWPYVGYFNVPKNVMDTEMDLWDEFSEDLLDGAIRCAEGVIASLTQNRFLPLNPSYQKFFKREPFPQFTFHDVNQILDLQQLTQTSQSDPV